MSASKLLDEIRQTKPFVLVEEEAILNLMRTADVARDAASEFLKPFGISLTQYNVLRILRGAGRAGITCSQLAERMITRDPDITRLLDRMQLAKLVLRKRSSEDRRVVLTHISAAGLALVNGIDEPLKIFLRSKLGVLRQQLPSLIEHLENMREALG